MTASRLSKSEDLLPLQAVLAAKLEAWRANVAEIGEGWVVPNQVTGGSHLRLFDSEAVLWAALLGVRHPLRLAYLPAYLPLLA